MEKMLIKKIAQYHKASSQEHVITTMTGLQGVLMNPETKGKNVFEAGKGKTPPKKLSHPFIMHDEERGGLRLFPPGIVPKQPRSPPIFKPNPNVNWSEYAQMLQRSLSKNGGNKLLHDSQSWFQKVWKRSEKAAKQRCPTYNDNIKKCDEDVLCEWYAGKCRANEGVAPWTVHE